MCIAYEQAMMIKPDNANDPQQGGEVTWCMKTETYAVAGVQNNILDYVWQAIIAIHNKDMMTTLEANHYWYRYVSAKVRAINLKTWKAYECKRSFR